MKRYSLILALALFPALAYAGDKVTVYQSQGAQEVTTFEAPRQPTLGERAAELRAKAGEMLARRPHWVFGRRATGCAGSHAFSAGCNGAAAYRQRLSYGCAGATISAPVGCSGGSGTLAAPVAGPALMPPAPVAAPTALGGGFVERARVHRQLRVALRQGKLSPADAAVAQQAIDDPDVYDASVAKITRDLNKKLAASGHVGALGDGHILQLLLANLPAIIDAIKQILAIFGPHAFALPCLPETCPLRSWERHPMPQPPPLLADYRLAC
jgi:hypothetical protein